VQAALAHDGPEKFASGLRDPYSDLGKRKEWWSVVADGRCLDAAGGMKILANMAEMDIPIPADRSRDLAKIRGGQPGFKPPHREIVS
jgi:hypothetical protein